MRPHDLKNHVEMRQGGSEFFSKETMKFFGDTMANYGVAGPKWVDTRHCGKVQVYELYRKAPVKYGVQNSAYFDAVTFRRVFSIEPEVITE